MKSLVKNNSIFSRIKEDLTSLLSFSDGSQYTSFEEENTLSDELKSSLESLNLRAKNYENNNMIIISKTNTSKHTSKLNKITPPVPHKKNIKKEEEKNKDNQGLEL